MMNITVGNEKFTVMEPEDINWNEAYYLRSVYPEGCTEEMIAQGQGSYQLICYQCKVVAVKEEDPDDYEELEDSYLEWCAASTGMTLQEYLNEW